MTAWLNDVRFALRLLSSRPGVTAAAALSLGLGIGANTAIFSLVNEVFLSPLPVERPAELVALFTTVPQNQQGAFGQNFATSRMNFEDYRTRTDVFTDLTAAVFLPFSLSGGSGEPEQVFGQLVTGNYFRTLGPPMALGRGFVDAEDAAPGSGPVTVLSYGLWQRRYGGAPEIVGRTVTVNGLPLDRDRRDQRGLHGIGLFGVAALWVPFSMHREFASGFLAENWDSRRALLMQVIGRLKPGVLGAGRRRQRPHRWRCAGRGLPGRQPRPHRHGRAARRDDAVPGAGPAPGVHHRRGAADRGRRAGAAHRLRQRRQPAARAGRGPPPRDRGAAVDRRQPRPADPPAARSKA